MKRIKEIFGDTLRIKNIGKETVEDQKVITTFYPVGKETELEFLESAFPDGTIAKFIEKNSRRGGIQYLALRVDNMENAIAGIRERGTK